MPTLAIVGEKDGPDIHAIADTLASRIVGARKVVIPGSGHLVNMERPEEFNRVVMEFISSNSKRK